MLSRMDWKTQWEKGERHNYTHGEIKIKRTIACIGFLWKAYIITLIKLQMTVNFIQKYECF